MFYSIANVTFLINIVKNVDTLIKDRSNFAVIYQEMYEMRKDLVIYKNQSKM